VTTSTAFPSSTSIVAGTLRSGDATRLRVADGATYDVGASAGAADWYGRIRLVPNSATTLKLTYGGRSSTTCEQRLGVYNWTTGVWAWLDARPVGSTAVEVTVSPTGTIADYVSNASGDGDVAVRVRCTRTDGVAFYSSGDLMKAVFTQP
jgi:hypothetical protein